MQFISLHGSISKMLKIQYIGPLALITINCVSSAVWFIQGDWRKGVYWLAAAVLNFVVTF